MTLHEPLRRALLWWANSAHVRHRDCDFRIGSADAPYLLRWYVYRNGVRWRGLSRAERVWRLATGNPREDQSTGRNVFVHRFLRSDDDRALHDHPWRWRTILLDGRYREHVPLDPADPAGPTVGIIRQPGTIGPWRSGTEAHRVELFEGPVTTLFQTGPKEREWGFWCPQGFRHWRDFTAPGDSGRVGRGCE